MAEAVRIAVVGAGLVGRQHVLRVQSEPAAQLAAIVDPSPPARELAASLAVPWFPDLEALLGSDPPEAVIIATPNQLHVAHGLACVAAGLPMLMEKPIAEEVAAGWRLVEAAEQADVPMLVGHHRRHSPLIRRARQIVAEGRLGRLVSVCAICWFRKPESYFETAAWRREPGAGPVLINLIHVIDDLRNLCGEVARVQAIESNAVRGFAVEDGAAILLHFASGALGTVSVADSVPAPWSWELTSGEIKAFPQTDASCYLLGGTAGSLSLPRLERWHYPGEPSWWAPLACTREVAPEQDPMVLQLRQFCKVVRREEPPLLGGREAMRTLETTLAVKQAAASGEVVRLP